MNLEPIDTSTTAGKAEVMRLAAEGRDVAEATLQSGSFNGRYTDWSPTSSPLWDWRNCRYAIIAEPVGPDEVWVTVSEGDPIDVYKDETTAACSTSWEVVRYVRAD